MTPAAPQGPLAAGAGAVSLQAACCPYRRGTGRSGPVVSPPPTHAELAGRVNSHREAVTRELGAMDRAGLIERRRGAIVLVGADRLRREVAEAVAA